MRRAEAFQSPCLQKVPVLSQADEKVKAGGGTAPLPVFSNSDGKITTEW
ncbi:hypothetical protein ATPR_2776 [Acetobacter tropicalis NBRC 101654]|uniref:Uncharacterized protein n=1 Tax=Acetobacter tropicalis NBRC 101654 TaxID=749388 RepID=F7VHC7_9PROT|nr:hypothetical protein ATPR_2776 [Acetobacter tropicalis NBRC 101654]